MAKNIEHIQHVKSNVVIEGKPKLPTSDVLVDGEIAVNYATGYETLSIKNANGVIVPFSSDNYYTEMKLGSGFTGENSAVTVTQVIEDNERVISASLNDLNANKLDASAYTPTDLSDYYTKEEVDVRDLWVSGTGENAVVLKGGNNIASGNYSVAEGMSTSATSYESHAEGYQTLASGSYSHAEGNSAKASGSQSHAEGYDTKAIGDQSHAEGWGTSATTYESHAEGMNTLASGSDSHAEGMNTKALGNYSHAEGRGTKASKTSSHAEGEETEASGDYGSHTEGWKTSATSESSHAEGYNTLASGGHSHAEGNSTISSGYHSHAEGETTLASGDLGSHAEGESTSATSDSSHAEGSHTIASGTSSHAEGHYTIASGYYGSHAEGDSTSATSDSSHAEGGYTLASGDYSHAEGENTIASGAQSHAEGNGTIANNNSEHASGQYNVSSSASTEFGDSGNTLFSVGNGDSDDSRHNAFEIRQNGDIYIVSGDTDILLQDYLSIGVTVDQVLDDTTSASTNPISSQAVYSAITDNELVWTNAYVTISGAISSHTEDTSVHLTSTEKANVDSLATNIDVISGITSSKVSNWDDAATNSHTHSNIEYLNSITGSVGTMAYENSSSYSSATQVSTALDDKADLSGLTAHTADTSIHVTSSDKENWNGKLSISDVVSAITSGTSASTYPPSTDAIMIVLKDNEEVVSAALNDLDMRVGIVSAITVESNLSNVTCPDGVIGNDKSGVQAIVIYENGGNTTDYTITVNTSYKTPDGAQIEMICKKGGYCEISYINVNGVIYARGTSD